MYRKCDNCYGIFKLPKLHVKRIKENKFIQIYCPYCQKTMSHKLKSKNGELLTSKEGIFICQKKI